MAGREPASDDVPDRGIWEAGDIVVDVGTYDSPRGAGKYVVLYERQADGSLKLAVDAVLLDGDAP